MQSDMGPWTIRDGQRTDKTRVRFGGCLVPGTDRAGSHKRLSLIIHGRRPKVISEEFNGPFNPRMTAEVCETSPLDNLGAEAPGTNRQFGGDRY